MEIIKSKPSAPKFDYDKWVAKHGFDPNATKKEKGLWFGREQDYWMEGRFGLTGLHYFALTQGTFESGTGAKIRPVWRDADDDIYGGYHDAKSRYCDYLVLKRREIGLSAIFGGVVPIHTALCYPGSTSVLTSADKTRLEQLYKKKLRVFFDNLDPDYRPNVVSSRQWGYLHMGKDVGDGVVQGLNSIVAVRDTVVEPTAFEAYRAMHIFIDEFFLHPKADRVHRSAQASVKAGFRKLAPIVMGGSAGEGTIEGQKKGLYLWNNAEDLDIVTMFIPAWKGVMEAPEYGEDGKPTGKLLNFCPNGHSDEKSATEWIMRTRERLDRLEDKMHLESFIKQYPLTVNEVFSIVGVGSLPQDIMNVVKTQERIILSSSPQIERVDVSRDPASDKIQILPSTEGKILMLQRPIPGHLYAAGIDPIPYNTDEMVGSDQAIAIKDLDTNRYVCLYKDRDKSPDVIVETQIMLQELYGDAKAMIEVNRGGVTKDRYVTKGKTHLLAKKPVLIGKGLAKGPSSFGYYKNDWTAQRGIDYLFEYLRSYWNEVWFIEVIDELKLFLTSNTDYVDAIISCEIFQKHIEIKKKLERPKNAVRDKKPTLVLVNGRYVKRWV